MEPELLETLKAIERSIGFMGANIFIMMIICVMKFILNIPRH